MLQGERAKSLVNIESETWYDLVNIYSSMSHWSDAEICLSKLKNISPLSALRWHATGYHFIHEFLSPLTISYTKHASFTVIYPSYVLLLVVDSMPLKQFVEKLGLGFGFFNTTLSLSL